MDPLKEFRFERDIALLSLSEPIIRAYCQKWEVPLPGDMELFWLAVHQARLQISYFEESEKELSRKWITEHGYKPIG